MKAFKVSQGDLPIAVVFHDHGSGDLYCRSVVRSFSMAFDAECSKASVTFKKDPDSRILRAVESSAREYDWARSVLDRLCDGFWSYEDLGNVLRTESGIDDVIRKNLS